MLLKFIWYNNITNGINNNNNNNSNAVIDFELSYNSFVNLERTAQIFFKKIHL